MVDPNSRREVSAEDLRAAYRNSAYPQRIADGELSRTIIYERLLPGGGSSRIIAYTEPGEAIKRVVVHQRIRSDGSVTEPDPKLLFLGECVYWTR